MRAVATLVAAAAVVAAIAGVLIDVFRGGTPFAESLAYGFWLAAALCLVLMLLAGTKLVWRAASRPLPEGWVFFSAATTLTVVGAVIDALGG
jgi:hypothetical protein